MLIFKFGGLKWENLLFQSKCFHSIVSVDLEILYRLILQTTISVRENPLVQILSRLRKTAAISLIRLGLASHQTVPEISRLALRSLLILKNVQLLHQFGLFERFHVKNTLTLIDLWQNQRRLMREMRNFTYFAAVHKSVLALFLLDC